MQRVGDKRPGTSQGHGVCSNKVCMKLRDENSYDDGDVVVSGPLKGYFFGFAFRQNGREDQGLAGFAFPDLGILFKSRYKKPLYECQYEGLLALLTFADEYSEIFKDIELEIFTDSVMVNFQINHDRSTSGELKKYRDKALSYRKKIRYKIGWVPSHENRAIGGYEDMITTGRNVDLKIDQSKLIRKESSLTGQRDSSE